MSMRTALWRVGSQPMMLGESVLATEQQLENMIVAAPSLLSDEWMLIGRQEDTGYGGRIDLLALAPDGSLVLIELKRDRTPREVVAQALDYATWVENLEAEDVAAIYGRFAPGCNLADDFRKRFGHELDDDELNQSHQIIIVAAALDPSTERILGYLSKRDIPINVLCFQVFADPTGQLLSRTWLLDPTQTQVAATAPRGESEPWNGEFYCSFGNDESRSWQDAVELGFISGGGGPWYSRTLQLLEPGDRVWVNIPHAGYVGVGRVTGRSQPASEFVVTTSAGAQSILGVAKRANYSANVDDPDKCEYFVPIHWLQTIPIQQAVHEVGMFGNQNTVCKPTASKWRVTVERLKQIFVHFDDESTNAPRAGA